MNKYLVALSVLLSTITFSAEQDNMSTDNKFKGSNQSIIYKKSNGNYTIIPFREVKFITISEDGEWMEVVTELDSFKRIYIEVIGRKNIEDALRQISEFNFIVNNKIKFKEEINNGKESI